MTSLHSRKLAAALVYAVGGIILFQFYGNSTFGYIATRSLFYWWGFQWVDPTSETEHGLLVLALAVWLYCRNLRYPPAPGRPAISPVLVMIGALGLHAVGFVAQQARISIVALLLFSWGAIAASGGRRLGRAAAFPLFFMVFAIPLSALDTLGFWLRMGVVSSSSSIVHVFGIGVIRSGTQLISQDGRYNYDVAAACSGVHSLIALAALSLLVGYLRFRSNWLRAGFLLVSLPLVYLANVVRIVAIVVAAQWGGRSLGDFVHAVMGYGVFVIVLAGVLGLSKAILHFHPNRGIEEAVPEPAAAPSPAAVCWAPMAAVFILVIAEACLLSHARLGSGPTGIVLARDGANPVDLPGLIGSDWFGRSAEVTEMERQILPADTGYSRKRYVSLDDPRLQVFLSIVLSGRDRTSIHRPELCLVAQGWTIEGSFEHRFRQPGSGNGFPSTVLRVKHGFSAAGKPGSVEDLVAYWFVGGDTIVATHWERMARDAWNRIAHGRADRWAYILIQTEASDGEEAALARMQRILDGTLPVFQKPIEGSQPLLF